MPEEVLSVSALNRYVKSELESDARLRKIAVQGEISNFKVYASGHAYFSLKDADGAVRCVMFRSAAAHLRFRPQNGMSVIATGSVTLYVQSGDYQLNILSLIPAGVGDLQMAFEQLKAKLAAEGLFDEKHKKPIPLFPNRVAVITSGSGAAVHDVIRVMGKRWPSAKVIVLPVSVQGAAAPPEIVGAIRYANRYRVADVIITGRGGGSIEDLWAFNDERVARAIYESELPIISAVGHEPDVTIADYVADRRAATPSNAAEIVVPDVIDISARLENMDARMLQAFNRRLQLLRHRLKDLSARPSLTDPGFYLNARRIELDMRTQALSAALEKKIAERRRDFAAQAAKLDALSPLKVIARGYSITEKDGQPIRTVKDTSVGEHIAVRMNGGTLGCMVEEIKHERKNRSKTKL